MKASDLSTLSEATKLVQAGRDPFAAHGFVNTPVYRGSTVLYPTVKDLREHKGRYSYARRGTPTSDALEEALTLLEGGHGAVLCPSGLSAVSVALLFWLKDGHFVSLALHHKPPLGPVLYMLPILILTLVVIVTGGIGSIRGAFYGALIVGIVDQVTHYRDAGGAGAGAKAGASS